MLTPEILNVWPLVEVFFFLSLRKASRADVTITPNLLLAADTVNQEGRKQVWGVDELLPPQHIRCPVSQQVEQRTQAISG